MTEKPTYDELEKRIRKLENVEYKYKIAKKALWETEGRYRAVVEDMPELICSYLPGGEITFVNKAYCDCFGKTFEALVGTNFLSLIPESEQKAVMDNISALKVESPTQSHEHKVIAPNGSIHWQSWTNRALFDDQGKAVEYQSIGMDITARKQVEEALRDLGRISESLEHYGRAIEINRETGDRSAEATACARLGVLMRDEGRLDESARLGERARRISAPPGLVCCARIRASRSRSSCHPSTSHAARSSRASSVAGRFDAVMWSATAAMASTRSCRVGK